MFGFTTYGLLKCPGNPLTGPTTTLGGTWKETWKILKMTNTSPFQSKRPDPSYTITYLEDVPLTIGGERVMAHHLKIRRVFKDGVTGAMERHLWYSLESGLLLKHRTKSVAKGMLDVTIDQEFQLLSLTPKK